MYTVLWGHTPPLPDMVQQDFPKEVTKAKILSSKKMEIEIDCL